MRTRTKNLPAGRGAYELVYARGASAYRTTCPGPKKLAMDYARATLRAYPDVQSVTVLLVDPILEVTRR